MKESLVEQIHRRRAAYAKRFSYDVHAIGENIRRCEAESCGVFASPNRRAKPTVKPSRAKSLAAHA